MTTRSPRTFFDSDGPGSKAILNTLGENATFESDAATVKVVFTRRTERDYATRRSVYIDEMVAKTTDVAETRKGEKLTRVSTGQRFEVGPFSADSTGWLRWRLTEVYADGRR